MTTTVPKIFAFHEFSDVAEAVADHVVHAQDGALAPKNERKHSVPNISMNALDMTREASCKSTASAAEGKVVAVVVAVVAVSPKGETVQDCSLRWVVDRSATRRSAKTRRCTVGRLGHLLCRRETCTLQLE